MLAMDALAFEKMKSNRRKQRTPIRVAYDPKDPGASFPKVPPEEEFANGVGSDAGSDNEHMEDEENKNSKSSCNTYPETFPAEEDLRNNASERHASAKSNEPEDMSVAFPTKYHRLGSELFQETNFMSNGQNKKESNEEKDKRESVEREIPNSTSDIDMTDIQNEEGVKVDGGNRIFHPDAYCEICDREFCNKYFLKTHKANKHGIFDNSPSPFSMGGMPPSMVGLPEDATSFPLPHPTPLPPSQPTSSSFKVMDFLQSLPATEPKFPSKLEQHSTPKPLDKSLPNNSENINTTNKDDILSSRSTPTSNMMNNNNNNTNANKDNNNSASKINKDMEDFCELCQKHFCNKYYLKKHKQDVHGITPPEGLSSSKRGRAKDLQLKLDAITSSAGAIPTSASPLIPHSIASMAGLPNMPGVMVLNPFMPPMLIPGSLLGQSQFAPPMMPQPLNGSSASQNSPPSSLITTTASQSSPIDAMRERMGGSGGKESFCQLCQKEFCNEHFLKIHKANKHGIYDDTSPESSGRMFDPTAAVSKPTANTSEIPSSTSNTDGSKDLGKPDSSPKPGTSLVTNSSSQDNYVTYCNLCNQEFASKYTYRIHRIQVHGMLNEGMDIPLSEDMIKQSMKMKEEAMKMSPRSKISDDGPIENRMSENGLSTMFGNMVAAKLADRVTCEICNKDLCNKYFLKVHMFKVHGVEQNSDKMDSNKISKSQYTGESDGIKNLSVKQEMKDPIHHSPKLPTSLPLPVLPKSTETPIDMSSGNPSAEKLSSEELVKMGIDPEAYCEICKKEFCSKYFLRTHRLNIHGIRSDKSESPQHHDTVDRFSLNHLAATALNKPLNLSMNGGKTKFGFEKHTWRWKEPVNSSRVSCEICNKELCNKYFLRTHKLRKHGILPSDGEKMSLNSSPTTSDVETYSNSSLPTDLSIHDRNLESPSIFKMDNGLMSSRSNTMLNFEDRKAKIGDIPNFKMKSEEEMSMTDQYYNHYSEVCHLCNRRFKSTKWLKAHIWKDHAGMTAFSPDIRKFIEGFDMNVDSKCCEICKVVFPSELSMQLHMIQEHNAKIALNTSPTQNGDSPPKKRVSRFGPRFAMKRRMSFLAKQKFYSCSICDYKSKWLSNVTSHEESYHDILPRGVKMDASQMNTDNVLDLAKRNTGDVKNFKCKTCGRKFSSAIHCHKHIREEHIRGQNYRVNNKISKVHLSCKFCPFATRFSKQLRHHMIRVHNSGRYNSSVRDNSLSMSDDFSGNNASQPLNLHAQAVKNAAGDDGSSYTLQSFQIENPADDSDFVTALVKMPVRKHISGPVSVTFLLTPTMDD
ncbi:hypothetical protein KUTeg_016551 [Tegillarca granosa]|uniref:C2H2-type domain-containing protein n=1 Tax=Tegillarca granosa TaxID=220873 RepID=A0ABQ9EL82_TEGGR|nr:hypothetical protein KUTeg_016551 [Tegillarca granosa]